VIVQAFRTMHPLLKALFFLCLLIVCMTLSFAIGIAACSAIYGLSAEQIANASNEMDLPNRLEVVGLLNIINQIGTFLGGTLLFILLFGSESVLGLLSRGKISSLTWLAPLALITALPLVEASYLINAELIPEGSWIESVFKPLEEMAKVMTEQLLVMDSPKDLFINLLFIALLPALAEEFAFRGVLQVQFSKATGNVHLGIWITALLFSAIHAQFYGFLPRMVLGAILGYVLIHSGSIWAAVLAHFTNNALLVVGYYFQQRGVIEVDGLESTSTQVLPLLIMTLIFVGIMWVLNKKSRWPSLKTRYLSKPV
jgi:uncharacterized protein